VSPGAGAGAGAASSSPFLKGLMEMERSTHTPSGLTASGTGFTSPLSFMAAGLGTQFTCFTRTNVLAVRVG
jgi:hypothetical protein